jgi:hypothetical protein
MGKSTIAATISHSLHIDNQLGATFFFSRSASDRSKPDLVFSTLALQLVLRYPQIFEGVCEALKRDPNVWKSAVKTQFRELISVPLLAAKRTDKPVVLVLVLDALDECSDPSAVISSIR